MQCMTWDEGSKEVRTGTLSQVEKYLRGRISRRPSREPQKLDAVPFREAGQQRE